VIYKVAVTATARADAVEGFRWIADQSPDAAARWYVGLEQAIATLTTMPERHPIAQDESEQLGITLRRMLYGRRRGIYHLLFSIEAKTVVLHYVCHGARDPSIAIGQ
jgi:plasmid stabilization system protein ParE